MQKAKKKIHIYNCEDDTLVLNRFCHPFTNVLDFPGLTPELRADLCQGPGGCGGRQASDPAGSSELGEWESPSVKFRRTQ